MNKKAIAGLLSAASLVTLAACNNNKANNAMVGICCKKHQNVNSQLKYQMKGQL